MLKLCLLAVAALALGPQAVMGLVGGVDANPGEFPFQVFLKYDGSYICCGALISDKHVLTAAHCVDDLDTCNLTALVGTNFIKTGGRIYDIVAKKSHPKYTKTTTVSWMYDINICTLKSNVALPNVNVVKLPTIQLQIGTFATVSSAGFTSIGGPPSEVLQKLRVKIIDRETCQRMLDDYSDIDESHICTFAPPEWGTALGDSGSPLTQNGFIFGVMVGCIKPGAQGLPDIYTDVFHYLPWIKKVCRL